MRSPALAVLCSLFLAPSFAFGATAFQIKDRKSDLGSDPASQLILTALTSAANSLESTVNDGFLSETSRRTFLSAMAKANASGSNALSLDHGSNPSKFLIGGGAQVGINGTGKAFGSSSNSLPSMGGSLQASTLIGVNGGTLGMGKAGPLEGRRLMLYLNFLSYSTTVDAFTAGFFNFGLRAQYKLVPKVGPVLANWGGVDFGSGFSYSSLSAKYVSSMDLNQQVTVTGSETVNLSWKSNYDLGIKSTNYSIPLELSTNASLLYVFTIFAGGGLDLNFGKSVTTGGADGPITAAYAGSTTVTGNLFSATGSVNLEDDTVTESPSVATGRFFGGLQWNLWALKFVGEFVYLTNKTYGGMGSIRLAF